MEPYDSRAAKFDKFHRENPEVWKHFEKFSLKLARGGWSHYSHDTIIAVVRFRGELKTNGVPYKIANEHKAFYGRMFMAAHGFYRNRFFHLRQMDGEPDECFAKYYQ